MKIQKEPRWSTAIKAWSDQSAISCWTGDSPGGNILHLSAALWEWSLIKDDWWKTECQWWRTRLSHEGSLEADRCSSMSYLSVSDHRPQGSAFLLMRKYREGGVTEGAATKIRPETTRTETLHIYLYVLIFIFSPIFLLCTCTCTRYQLYVWLPSSIVKLDEACGAHPWVSTTERIRHLPTILRGKPSFSNFK